MATSSARRLRIASHSISELDRLEDIWMSLETGPDMTVFQSWDWHQAVRQRLRSERLSRLTVRHRIYVVYDGDSPILIAPLRIHHAPLSRQHLRGIHFMGREGTADYLNFIYDEFSPTACHLALATAAADFNLSTITLDRVLEGTRSYEYLESVGTISQRDVAVSIRPTPNGTYEAGLSKRSRQNLRTASNRLKSDRLMALTDFGGAPDASDLAEFIRLKEARTAAIHARNSQPGLRSAITLTRRGYRALLFTQSVEAYGALMENEHAWHMTTKIDGQLAAFALGFIDPQPNNRTLRVTHVAFDDKWKRYSPGIIGLHTLLQRISTGEVDSISVVDFTRGEEHYKYALGGIAHALSTFQWQI